MAPHNSLEFSAEDLAFTIDPDDIARFRKDLRNNRIIGQPRALKALRMGCRITGKGYNIFVTGKPGTGRKTTVERILQEISLEHIRLKDIAIVYNFRDPERPMVLYLEPGGAKRLKNRVHDLIETLKQVIKDKLEGEPYNSRKNALLTDAEQAENARINEFEAKLEAGGFKMVQIEEGGTGSTDLVPSLDGEPVSFDELQERVKDGRFPQDEWNRIRELYHRFMDEMRQVFRNLRSSRLDIEEEVKALQKQVLMPEISLETEAVRNLFTCPEVHTYLDALEEDILDNLYIFTADGGPVDESGNRSFVRYGVNILLDHSETTEVPVIFETRPDPETLVGSIEYRFERESEVRTNFLMIRPGSLIRACGGFLVIEAEQLLKDEAAWLTLKQALKTHLVEIHPPRNSMNLPVPAPRPEPVRVDPKVILIGGEDLYDLLYTGEPDFHKLFKIAAEFDDSMERSPASTVEYLSYIRDITESEALGAITDDAAAEVIAFGAELAEDRRRLSTRFFRIADLLTEARYWADREEKPSVDRASVRKAVEEHRYLLNLPEERTLDMVQDNSILLNLEGTAVGRINGLAVRDRGSHSFGVPAVISCSVSPGGRGVVNIEREAGLSGEIHDKWVFILEGLLRSRYAGTFPLSLHASICFEQSYGGIDGDSASAAEACALLSALSGVPFRQDLAVTGSINQAGDLQPVGGISDKVRGFYNICSRRGLTGTQGVVIPQNNLRNLFLDEDTLAAVREGSFHLYGADTIDEVLQLLSGLDTGRQNEAGEYPEGSLSYLVENTLKTMAEQVKLYRRV